MVTKEISKDTNQALIDTAVQIDIINHLSEKLKSCYVFPDAAEQMCSNLQKYLHDGEYTDLTEGNLFALVLTMHLQEVNHDEHL